jgi:hypothetical protein
MNHSPVKAVKENYYIGSLPGIVDGRELRRYLQQFGEVESLEIIKDATTGKCKGYAFLSIKLTFSESKFLNMRHFYDGRIIFIRQKLQGSDLKQHKDDFQQKRLYISTNSRKLSDHDLFVYFSAFGEVDLAYFVKNHNKSKDKVFFGYVNFKFDDSVRQVMAISKHLINKQEVKCDIFRPKKKSLDSFEREKPKTSESYKISVQSICPRPAQIHVLLKQKTPDTPTILSSEDKKAQERAPKRLLVNKTFQSELQRLSRELDAHHYYDNLRFNACPQLPVTSLAPVYYRTRV